MRAVTVSAVTRGWSPKQKTTARGKAGGGPLPGTQVDQVQGDAPPGPVDPLHDEPTDARPSPPGGRGRLGGRGPAARQAGLQRQAGLESGKE